MQDAYRCMHLLRWAGSSAMCMPINLVNRLAIPECAGKQWIVTNVDILAQLAALVLTGQVRHAARFLEGAQRDTVVPPAVLKARLQGDLFPHPGVDHWHRDGLLFEIICWIVARMSAGPGEVISDPHLKSTEQGADTIKIKFDATLRSLARATIFEYKCTDRARRGFKQAAGEG
jgi:hypothetical protein